MLLKNIIKTAFILVLVTSCQKKTEPKHFSSDALNNVCYTTELKKIEFKEILEAHKGKTICIDFWASWCHDCIGSLQKVKTSMTNNPEVVYLFMSVDVDQKKWRKGVEKYGLDPKNSFLVDKEWKSDLSNFLKLDWIPRYMVIDKTGNIVVYNAVKVNDSKIINALKIPA